MRRVSKLPPAEELNRLFSYEQDMGKIFWRVGRLRGSEAGSCQYSHGGQFFTHEVSLKGAKLATARVIWKMMTGEDPSGAVIHKNFNRTDLRWENLAVKGEADGVWRNHRPVRTKSGFLGVYPVGNKWIARVRGPDKKLHYLGAFETMEDAAKAVKACDKKSGALAEKLGRVQALT